MDIWIKLYKKGFSSKQLHNRKLKWKKWLVGKSFLDGGQSVLDVIEIQKNFGYIFSEFWLSLRKKFRVLAQAYLDLLLNSIQLSQSLAELNV